MLGQTGRRLLKRTLEVARVKLFYSKITLTRFTTLYFFFSLIACITLGTLQVVSFVHNSSGVSTLSPFILNVSVDTIIMLNNQNLQTCNSIPGQSGTICTIQLNFGGNLSTRDVSKSPMWTRGEELGWEDADEDDNDADSVADLDSRILSMPAVVSSGIDDNCITSLAWIGETIEDSKREDVVVFLFQIWLFAVALLAILNESIPHLGAAFLGHALGTGWAAFRIHSTCDLEVLYRSVVVPEACSGIDVIGNWWDDSIRHSIPIFLINVITSAAFLYLSATLYKVYTNESFSRVGASPSIHRIYKIALFFRVCLQLSGFFALGAIALWFDKFSPGIMMKLAKNYVLYAVSLALNLLCQFPSLFLGWAFVRRECKTQFNIFCGLSFVLLALATAICFSPVYRYLVISWPFFATVTTTSLVLLVATSILGIICRLNFGKGLAHYLRVTEVLEGVDFTPVSFSKGYESDVEKIDVEEWKTTSRGSIESITLQLPALAFQDEKMRPRRGSSMSFECVGNTRMLSLQLPISPDPIPVINPYSGEPRNILMDSPLRSSSVRLSPTSRRYGLPSNPREGR